MSWMDEQVKARMLRDEELVNESFMRIADSVMGTRLSAAFSKDSVVTQEAMGVILDYFHAKPTEIPEGMTDFNEQIDALTRPHGIMYREVKLEKGWRKDACGAMLGTFKEDGTAVALVPSKFQGYRFFDRKTGRMVQVDRNTEKLLDEDALVFYAPLPLKSLNIWDLWKFARRSLTVGDVAFFILATVLTTLVGMLMPKLNQLIFSNIIVSRKLMALVAVTLFMICVTLSQVMLGTLKNILLSRVSVKLDVSIRAASFMRVLTLPATFFKKYSAGELSSRMQQMNALCNNFVGSLFSVGISSLFSLAYVGQITAFAPSLVAPALVMVSLTILVSILSTLLQTRITRQQLELSSKESGMSYAMLTGIQKIKLAGAEKRMFARWGKLYAKSSEKRFNPPTFLKINSVISLAITLFGSLLIYYSAVKNQVSVADYYAFNSAYGMLSGAFMSLAGITLQLASLKPILEMVKPIMETVPEVSEGKEVINRLSGGIELNQVSFRYTADTPYIIDDLNLKIRPGQYVAIVGKTGCGKSTLVRLLLGFEKPEKGAIYYDGKDMNMIDLKSLRRRIGVVMQDGKLFTGDIFSNITVNAPWLTLDEAWDAAEKAGMADDIRRMPMGMNTMIMEGGGVSGGQKQRLMIARAIAPKPRLLIFDEATSALDNVTQKTVSESLDALKCTRIVIAHRLSTIRHCDRILVLDHGKIIEDGNYEQLIAKNGFFAELVARQRLDMPEENA